MEKIRVKIVSFREAKPEFIEKGKKMFCSFLNGKTELIDFVESDPEVLFVFSGGSEQMAKVICKKGNNYILIAHESNNSTAAAFEIVAYLNQVGITHKLILNAEEIFDYLINFFNVKSALARIKGKTLGLIGNVSEWLIASDIDKQLLKDKTGIILKQIYWDEMISNEEVVVDNDFIRKFNYHDKNEIANTLRIYELLNDCIHNEKLDAITVECFPMVQQKGITACLALSHFNDMGIPAACEGDITSAVGMMLVKEVCGTIPWMANISKIGFDGVLFAHCTIGTTLLNSFSVTTHYETGLGTAVEGDFIYDEVTIFRLDNKLSKAYVAKGIVIDRPKLNTACRTQLEIKIDEKEFEVLKNNPLGNHHLLIPGDQQKKMLMVCMIMGIEVVNIS